MFNKYKIRGTVTLLYYRAIYGRLNMMQGSQQSSNI